jgi:hypothetical protein
MIGDILERNRLAKFSGCSHIVDMSTMSIPD